MKFYDCSRVLQSFLIGMVFTALLGCGSSPTEVNEPDPPDPLTVTDFDGNVYTTVTIGTQIWMAENLKVTHYRNGAPIDNITDNTEWGNLTTGAYCNLNNDEGTVDTYGRQYNWYAANNTNSICPTGWHIPSDAEWTTLINYLGGSDTAGGKMKESGTAHWSNPNLGATNSSGFTALPGGYRNNLGIFDETYNYGFWWSSSHFNDTDGSIIYLFHNYAGVWGGNASKKRGYFIRCIKDTVN